jgi:beta-glucosidase
MWLNPTVSLDARVEALLGDLSQDEKVGVALSDWSPLQQRGLPWPHYVDAGTGLRGVEGATAFPAGIALAASFDEHLAERYGSAVGAEARSAGYTVLLGPTLDPTRDPRGGRIPEAFGEDPLLSGLLGAAHVRGVQRNHVIAQLKHFVAYNIEERRTGHGPPWSRGDAMDVRVSRATLQDVYLRPFRMAIEAGAWSMMGSYNRLNGEYVCESRDLLDIPRREWGWRGFYCPDFMFAVRDDAKALAAGLDIGALDGPGHRTAEMLTSPDLPTGTVDTIVGNMVRALIGSGLVDDPLPEPRVPSTADHRDLARAAAVAGTVLLVNRNSTLPLAGDVRSIAIIGPSGADAFYVVGGSASVTIDPDRAVSPLDGLRARAGSAVEVLPAQGSLGDVPLPIVPAAAYTLPDGSGPGVLVETIGSNGSTQTQVQPSIDHAVGLEEMAAAWPRLWSTQLTSVVSGRHRLSLQLGGRAIVRVSGQVVMQGSRELERFFAGPAYPLQCLVDLEAGTPVALEIEYEIGPALAIPPEGMGPTLRLGWQPPDSLRDDAVATASRADVAVVIVTMASGEGMDRDGLALPGDQDNLVSRVAAANSRTVVVLNTPGAVLMPWLDKVAAVLQVWYPGEQFGTALADVLFGDAEPGGRLPLTFPLDLADLPGGDRERKGTPSELHFDEGCAIGYRSDRIRRHGALFPFGFGLSYSTSSHRIVNADITGDDLALRIEVSNRGDRSTCHVIQFYTETDAHRDRELGGLLRIPLLPGETTEAEMLLSPRVFARWNDVAGRRIPVDGQHLVHVATSSADDEHSVVVRVQHGAVTEVRAAEEIFNPDSELDTVERMGGTR